ncbi:hypothetical protein ACKKBF_B34840 [Auxenochlorella protothecoides x Auxenochlorella symbiontica]
MPLHVRPTSLHPGPTPCRLTTRGSAWHPCSPQSRPAAARPSPVCFGRKKTIEEINASEPTGVDPGGDIGRLAPKDEHGSEKSNSTTEKAGPSAGVPHQEGYTERTQRAVEENEVDAQELGFSAARSDAKFTTAASPGDHHSGATDGDKPVGGDGAQIAGDVE